MFDQEHPVQTGNLKKIRRPFQSSARRRLALDEIYHPIRAAFPNNPTLRNVNAVGSRHRGRIRGSRPPRRPLFRGLVPVDAWPAMTDRKTTIRKILGPPDFKFELRPLRSLLLRTSWLVSFPPVINMLKFTG